LAGLSLEAFNAFFHCVQRLGTVKTPTNSPFTALVNRLHLARFIGSDNFTAETLGLFVQAAIDLKRIPSAKFVRSVYSATHPGASLRRLMVDMIVWEEVPEYMQWVKDPEELRSDVITASMARNCGRSVEARPWKKVEKYLRNSSKRVQIKKEGSNKRKRTMDIGEDLDDDSGAENLVSVVFGTPARVVTTAVVDLTLEE